MSAPADHWNKCRWKRLRQKYLNHITKKHHPKVRSGTSVAAPERYTYQVLCSYFLLYDWLIYLITIASYESATSITCSSGPVKFNARPDYTTCTCTSTVEISIIHTCNS